MINNMIVGAPLLSASMTQLSVGRLSDTGQGSVATHLRGPLAWPAAPDGDDQRCGAFAEVALGYADDHRARVSHLTQFSGKRPEFPPGRFSNPSDSLKDRSS
jgi:hypothetical protein